MTGKVYLVGAGPGDPGLITVRGRQCLTLADVVIYDDLVHPDLVRLAREAETIYVGKRTDQHSLTQTDINRVLIEQAGRRGFVVRLKGGDPFVFGRGGEEALALTEAGIAYEVVPGVTAGVAAPAYAGIPVTHRGMTSSVSFITGHGLDPASANPLDLSRLAQEGTLCFYMSVRTLPQLARQLMDLGRSRDTPAAIIGSGTFAIQQSVVATLGTLTDQTRAANIEAPAMIVVGDVVGLREQLAWFEARPLHRVRIAVTHMDRPEGELEQRLRDAGADIFRYPMVEITAAPPDPTLDRLPEFDWIFLTSNNATELVLQRLYETGGDTRELAGICIAAIGAKTTRALEQVRLRPDIAVASYRPEDVAEALHRGGLRAGARVLFPRPDLTRRDLVDMLHDMGAAVTEVITHRRSLPADVASRIQGLLSFKPAWLIFTNAAAAHNFMELTRAEDRERLLASARIASIGPSTTAALREAGLAVALEPEVHTVAGLVGALAAHTL